MDRIEIFKRFTEDIKNHEMKIITNDGVNRCIRFSRPGDSNYYFNIITWPGELCISGDMGTYVFYRVHDMFEFFRQDGEYVSKSFPGVSLDINPEYWGEKLQSVDKCSGYKNFSSELFKENIRDYFDTNTEDLNDGEKAELWHAIETEIFSFVYDGEYPACAAVHNFTFTPEYGGDYIWQFDDFDYDASEYTYHFLWCLFAIVWGIKCFDAGEVVQP